MLVNGIAGAAVGLLAAAVLYVLHFAGLLRTPLGSQLMFLALAFHITGLIAALAYHRRRLSSTGEASFLRLFGAGLMVSLVAGLVLAAGTQLFLTAVDPTYLDWLKESSFEQLAAAELTDEQRTMHREQIAGLTATSYAVQTLTSTLVAGFFLSLTLAALLRIRVLRQSRD